MLSMNLSAAALGGVLLVAAGSVSAQTISVSTDVLNGGSAAAGTLADGATAPVGVDLVRFIPLGGTYGAVVYNSAGDTVNLTPYISTAGCCERGAGQNLHINGYSEGGSPTQNLYLRGEPNVNNEGFGAHANWLVTIDLNEVRANQLGGATDPLELTGQFGAWGGIGSTDPAAGVIQGAIFLDGARIDTMGQTVANPTPVNQSFDLDITSGRYLTFAILNGSPTDPQPTLWDDGLFENVNLAVVPEPAALGLIGLAGGMLLSRRRR